MQSEDVTSARAEAEWAQGESESTFYIVGGRRRRGASKFAICYRISFYFFGFCHHVSCD